MPLKGFISYAHADRVIAGAIKGELADYGINCFLAHEDLEPTVQWQEEITKHLKACDLFIALLSKPFRESNWTDQEVGMAVAWKKKLIPLVLDTITAHGFIGKYQATKIDAGTIQAQLLTILNKLREDKKVGVTVTEGLITALADSENFNEAERRVKAIIAKHATLTQQQLNRIVEASSRNNQIYGGRNPKAAISTLIKEHPAIDAKLVKRFRQAIGEIELD